MIKLKDLLNEVKPAVVGNVNAFGPSKVLGKGGKVLGFVPDTPNAIATLIQDYPNVQAIEFKSPFFFDFKSYKSIKKGDKAWKELMSRGVDKPTKAALKKDFQLKESVSEGLYHVGYNKGRGQGTGVFKDSYSSYKDAKKAVEKLEKERGGSYNMVAYYVSDKDGKFVKESVTEAELPKNGSTIKVSNIPIKIEYVSGGKYIGYSWKDKNNKEHYEETKVSEHSDLNSLIKTITAEIRYQRIHKKESVTEVKSDYEVYHKSYTSAIQAAKAYAEKKGYEINDDDSFRQIGMGPRKPSEGKTNKFSIELSKDGKIQRKKLQIQVYGMRNSYELNAYIQ